MVELISPELMFHTGSPVCVFLPSGLPTKNETCRGQRSRQSRLHLSRAVMVGESLRSVTARPGEAPSIISREGKHSRSVGIDISGCSRRQLNSIARQLNERPRKTLGFYTPAELFSGSCRWDRSDMHS